MTGFPRFFSLLKKWYDQCPGLSTRVAIAGTITAWTGLRDRFQRHDASRGDLQMSFHYDEKIDGLLVTHDKAAVVAQLQARVPDLLILHEQEDLRPFECDGLAAYRTTPMLVALPERTEQVEALLRFASERRIPVVARGSGTGLSGGALPLEKGILLVMSRFNRILELDPEACTARVQPGVRNLAISQAAAPHGLYYAPDPSSQIACSIGGNVAENAGGIHCLKYGLTVNNILKLEILTIDGERLTLGSEALDAPGFDLLALFTGSEGMLGIVVEVTVKLLTKPQSAKVLLASFDNVGKAGAAVAQIIGAGVIPGGLEMMDNLAIRAAEDFIHAGYPVDAEAILLCEVDGVESDAARIANASRRCCAARAPPKCGSPKMRQSASASGQVARTPSRRSGASRRITTAWTARFHAANCRACSRASRTCPPNMACRWPTCFMRATATCTR
jgi:FAD/FMN-containing dehydrogenase